MSTKGVGSVKIFPVWKPPNVTLFWGLIRLLQKSGPLLMPVNGVRKIALERIKARTWLKHVTKNANDTARKFAVAFSGQFLRSVYHWSKFYNLGYISLSKGYANLSYLWVLESFFFSCAGFRFGRESKYLWPKAKVTSGEAFRAGPTFPNAMGTRGVREGSGVSYP